MLGSVLPLCVSSLAGTVIVAIAAGANQSMAIDGSGSLWVWGCNIKAQLGTGDRLPRGRPMRLALEAFGGNRVCMVATGGDSSMALTTAGVVYVWGETTSGCLGVPRECCSDEGGEAEGVHNGVVRFIMEPMAVTEGKHVDAYETCGPVLEVATGQNSHGMSVGMIRTEQDLFTCGHNGETWEITTLNTNLTLYWNSMLEPTPKRLSRRLKGSQGGVDSVSLPAAQFDRLAPYGAQVRGPSEHGLLGGLATQILLCRCYCFI